MSDAPVNPPPSPESSAALAQVAKTDDALWSFTGVELVDVAPDFTLLLDAASGHRLLVKREVGICLTHCEPYRSLGAHARHLAATLPQLGGQAEPVVPVLQQICDAGLMRSAESVVQSLTLPVNKTPLLPVQVFIITCDRPDAVKRLLGSMANDSALDLPEAFTLIDDSRDPENAARNLELVQNHNNHGSFELRYFGAAARERLLDHLLHQAPELEDSVRFLLDRREWSSLPTYGLSRTLALLLGVGKRVLVFDDDVLCEAVRAPLPAEAIRFGSLSGRKAAFWDSAQALNDAKRTINDSPIALMTRQLGATLSGALGSLSHDSLSPDALAGANGAFVRTLSPDSRILQTQCGTWGDPGTGSGHWITELDTDSIDRLLACPQGLVATLDARCAWLGYEGPTLTKHGVMSQVTGYDASQLLPPFMPALRGEDSLFAFMSLTLHPDSLVLNHPWAIPHHPLEQRADRSLRGAIAPQGGIPLLTRWIGDNAQVGGRLSPEQRLQRMARGIEELTTLSDGDVKSFATNELTKWQASQVSQIQQQLQRAHQLESRNWLHYLERAREESFTALQTPTSWPDLLAHPTDDIPTTLEAVRVGGQRLARALEVWPRLWDAAKAFEP